MRWFQDAALTILQRLFPSEQPTETELIALGYQQALADLKRQQERSFSSVYEPPERQTEPIQLQRLPEPIRAAYRPGQRLHTYNARKRFKTRLVSPNDDFLLYGDIEYRQTEQVPVVWSRKR